MLTLGTKEYAFDEDGTGPTASGNLDSHELKAYAVVKAVENTPCPARSTKWHKHGYWLAGKMSCEEVHRCLDMSDVMM
jgi:hypothetical protein